MGVRGGQHGFGQVPAMGFQRGAWPSLQAQLLSSDEEWKVIGTKIGAVLTARSAVESRLDVARISTDGRQGPGFGPDGGPFDFGGIFDNDSLEGPGMAAQWGFAGPGGFGGMGPGGFDPNMFAQGMPRFGPGSPGGFDPNMFAQGMPGFGWGGPGGFDPGGGEGILPLFLPFDRQERDALATDMPGFGSGDPVTQALMELRTVVSDPNVAPEQINDKVSAVRAARDKAKAELAAARKDLRELLTADQEAVLIVLGYLD